MSRSAILPMFAAAGLLATALPAIAQPVSGVTVRVRPQADMEVKSQRVDFHDIDANSPDGARILFRRIRAAAEEACSPPASVLIKNLPDYDDARNFARCEVDGIRMAVADVNSPALSDYVSALR